MKIAYIDCFSGVAGDMLLAALLEAGAPLEKLVDGLRTIAPIRDEWDLEVQRVTRGTGSIAANHVNVISKYDHQPAAPPQWDGDHAPNQDHSHSHSHAHGHSHTHDHDHTGNDNEVDSSDAHHGNPVRNLSIISDMLQKSELPSPVKERSVKVFTALGEAEARTHGSTLEQVHFHEVGAIDSIIDTVGTVLALHLLGVEKVYCSALPFSEGTVWTAHGILPVPAPATLRLMTGVPTCPGPKSAKGELVTPTGAALVRVLSSEFGRPPPFTPKAIGIGAGTKDFDKHPNILRVIIGDVSAIPPELRPDPVDHLYQSNKREHEDWSTRRLCMFEANIDDMTGEVAGHLMEKLLGDGCLDTWLSPVFMKKNRPAYTVHVLCESNDQHHIMRLLFMESTTLGVRRYFVERCSLRRQMVTSSTPFGDVQMKVAWLGDAVVNCKPEYEDCKALSARSGVPLQMVMDQARAGAQAEIKKLSQM